jgi:hypothetical protein
VWLSTGKCILGKQLPSQPCATVCSSSYLTSRENLLGEFIHYTLEAAMGRVSANSLDGLKVSFLLLWCKAHGFFLMALISLTTTISLNPTLNVPLY